MGDNELLDLAARAQGWIDYPTDSIECGNYWHTESSLAPFGPRFLKDSWNPLEEDSQAFQLAIIHGMTVRIRRYNPSHGNPGVEVLIQGKRVFENCQDTDEGYAKAARRAIVRAVAEIGSKI